MTAVRLLRIELRRNLALWMFLPMIGIAWYFTWSNILQSGRLVFWHEVSVSVKNSVLILGPLMGALGALTAERSQRHHVEDLLATTPRPAPVRDLAAFFGTALFGIAAYTVASGVILVLAERRATWGLPHAGVMLVGFLTLIALGALGYGARTFFRSRFATPLIAMIMLAWIFYGGYAGQLIEGQGILDGIENLSPYDPHGHLYDVFHGLNPDYSVLQAVWLAGLAVSALAAVSVKRLRIPITCGVLAAAVLVTAVVGGVLLAQPARDEVRYKEYFSTESLVPYEPACEEGGALPVCVHPAYAVFLPDAASILGSTVRPLVGVSGGPVRAEQTALGRDFSPNGVLTFKLYDFTAPSAALARAAAESLTNARDVSHSLSHPSRGNGAQRVLADWLVLQAGFPLEREGRFTGFSDGSEERAALDRFAALDPEVQRAWIESNFAALRAGELAPDDLP